MLIFKALHVLSMFTMVTIFAGGEIYFSVAFLRRDVRALAFLHDTARRTLVPFIGLGMLILGIAFGLLTAATGGLDFFRPWLLIAYLLVIAFFVNSAVIGERMLRVSRRAVEAEAGRIPTEEVVREIEASPRVPLLFFPINAVIFAAIILDMVLKPF
jgi:Predicted integral membrane protein (DUF2269)